jgi:hypothetical protein
VNERRQVYDNVNGFCLKQVGNVSVTQNIELSVLDIRRKLAGYRFERDAEDVMTTSAKGLG